MNGKENEGNLVDDAKVEAEEERQANVDVETMKLRRRKGYTIQLN